MRCRCGNQSGMMNEDNNVPDQDIASHDSVDNADTCDDNHTGRPNPKGMVNGNSNKGKRKISKGSDGSSNNSRGKKSRESGSNSRKGNTQTPSRVWDGFTRVSKVCAVCKHCGKGLSASGTAGTNHLWRHLRYSCPNITRKQIKDKGEPPQDIARAVTSNLAPVSGVILGQYLPGMGPTCNMALQATTEQQILGVFQKEKLELKERMARTSGGVFLSVESWNIELKYFLCLAVHYIDEEWRMNRRIIKCSLSSVDGYCESSYYLSMMPDTAAYLRIAGVDVGKAATITIREAIQEWSLGQKLLGVTVPKPVGNLSILELEKNLTGHNYLIAKFKLLTVPCIVDALHDLFGFEIENFVLKASLTWFYYMTCSSVRKQKYTEVLSKLHLNCPSFGSQKWYLTFYLLEAALLFNSTPPNAEQMDPQLFTRKPSPDQLEATEIFCKIVRPIYHAIRVVSSPHYVFNSYFHVLWSLRTALQESSGEKNIERILDVVKMQAEFDKLWRKLYLWLSVAVILDPRYKMRFVEQCFREAFGDDANMYIAEVRAKICELFIKYSCHVNQQNVDAFNHIINGLWMAISGSASRNDMNQSENEPAGYGEFKELSEYLGGEPLPPNDAEFLGGELSPRNDSFDILKWWKDNDLIYPTLGRLARDVLLIPGCAVSTESAFDERDERVSLFHQKVSPEIVEAFICTQDWIKSSDTSVANADGGNNNVPI